MKDLTDAINALIPLKQQVDTFHPALEKLYPIAVLKDEHLLIYDSDLEKYRLTKRISVPMPIPIGVRAAFQLQDYDGRIACVVSPDVFESQEGYITILHEFVHCYQYETCEQELKLTLDIAQKAIEVDDNMWEINYPFPYLGRDFIRPYTHFMEGLKVRDVIKIKRSRKQLKAYLALHDFEYMIWQEWKEGFARWVENHIKQHLEMPQNTKGSLPPYDRVVFYAGGAALIGFLARNEPNCLQDLPHLFNQIISL
ncbi:MAG: hypothetical protein ACK2TV_01760 [Anaerolineales bacterium]